MLQPLNPVTWHSHGPSPGCKIKKGDCWRISDLKFLRGKSTIVLSSKFDSNCSWPLHQQFFISKNSQKFRNSKNPRIPTILLQWPQKQTSPARDLAPSPASPSLAAIVEDPAAPVDRWGLRGRPLWGSPGFPWEKRLLDAINTRADREEGAKNYGSTETGKKNGLPGKNVNLRPCTSGIEPQHIHKQKSVILKWSRILTFWRMWSHWYPA